MIEPYLPLLYVGAPIAGVVLVAKYYFRFQSEKAKIANKAKAPENSVESVFDEYAALLQDAPKYYGKMKEELDAIKLKNPGADLGDQELKLKAVEWAAKHNTIARIAVPIVKPIATRYIKRIQRSL